MPAPVTELVCSSISSSGHIDGLGRRSLSFDRETGAILERLYVRPELAVFEQILKKRVAHLSTLEDERFAYPFAVERDASTGELVVVAEFVTGSRLSELLDVSADAAVVPGVDVALGYLLDALPALSVIHTQSRLTHGLIDASRTVLTDEGQVVFLDVAFGSAVERLHLSRQRLWAEFGVSASPGAGPVVFDETADVTQVALGALMLVLGRNLKPREYPDAVPTLLMEVIEVAHIRGSTSFASGLQRILQRSLPLPGRRPYTSAEEALADVRQLVRREIGLDVCRQAIVDFVAQMDAAFSAASAQGDRAGSRQTEAFGTRVPELDHFLETFVVDDGSHRDEGFDATIAAGAEDDAQEDDVEELEISLDQFETGGKQIEDAARDEVYDLPALDDLGTLSSDWASVEDPVSQLPPAPVDQEPEIEPLSDVPLLEERLAAASIGDAPRAAIIEEFAAAIVAAEPSTETATAPALSEASADPVSEPAAATETSPESGAEQTDESEPAQDSGSSRRRKRQQQKSARARKDKLRSTTGDNKGLTSPPPPPPARPANPSGWLVSPQRAAASESLIPDSGAPPTKHAPTPAVPSFAPTPVGQIPQPTFAPAPVGQIPQPTFAPAPVAQVPQPTFANPSAQPTVYGTPTIAKPQPPPQAPTPPPPPAVLPVASQIRVKADPPAASGARQIRANEPVEPYSPADRFRTLSLGRTEEDEGSRRFPWKLAAVAVVIAAAAIGIGKTYLPGRTAVAGEPGAQVEATPEASKAADATKVQTPIPAGQGRISIQTQPDGIKVLLNRKPVGETPIQVDAPPGRHVLTFLTSGGEVLHSVRVVAGKAVTLDIPVFSGWVSVVAPIVLIISEGGRVLGSTEEDRLTLPPGRHQLTLSNKELGYSAVHQVDIEPGGVRSLTVDPKGPVNLNAAPWAEVWLDGAKLGDTPLAGTLVPLGLREFVFKHPEYGERRVSATVRANTPAAVSVDFTK
jgi:PEGA domain